MLILLAATCLAWVGILSLAFMVFTGSGIAAGWIFAGALIAALAVWVVLMIREFQFSPRVTEAFDDENDDLELELARDPAPERFGFRRMGLQIFSGRRRFSSGVRSDESSKGKARSTQRPIRPTFR
jgi:uncharacterized protein (DUF58 family)